MMFDPILDAPPPPAPRTPDGSPWVQWVKHEDSEGWCAAGTRQPGRASTFWEITFGIAASCHGVAIDQVHAASRGILAMGAFGVTLQSGYAQLLLHTCLVEDPVKFVDVMAPVFHATGAHTKPTEKSPSGIALADENGALMLSEERLRKLVLLGSNSVKWTGPQKQRARLWVSCVSELLRNEQMDRAQVTFFSRLMPELAGEELRQLIRWPRHGAEETWQYSREHQALWAYCFVKAMKNREYTLQSVRQAQARERARSRDEDPARILRDIGGLAERLPLVVTEYDKSERAFLAVVAAAFGVSHIL